MSITSLVPEASVIQARIDEIKSAYVEELNLLRAQLRVSLRAAKKTTPLLDQIEEKAPEAAPVKAEEPLAAPETRTEPADTINPPNPPYGRRNR
jgi:hypothetical protein